MTTKDVNPHQIFSLRKVLTFFLLSIVAGIAYAADSNSDGIDDKYDNCVLVANTEQRDTDNDGIGSICDADLNNDDIVNAVDFGIFRSAYLSSNADADFNGDGIVNILDFNILRGQYLQAPGPAGADVDTPIAGAVTW